MGGHSDELSPHGLSGSALAESWNRELALVLGTGGSDVDCGRVSVNDALLREEGGDSSHSPGLCPYGLQ